MFNAIEWIIWTTAVNRFECSRKKRKRNSIKSASFAFHLNKWNGIVIEICNRTLELICSNARPVGLAERWSLRCNESSELNLYSSLKYIQSHSLCYSQEIFDLVHSCYYLQFVFSISFFLFSSPLLSLSPSIALYQKCHCDICQQLTITFAQFPIVQWWQPMTKRKKDRHGESLKFKANWIWNIGTEAFFPHSNSLCWPLWNAVKMKRLTSTFLLQQKENKWSIKMYDIWVDEIGLLWILCSLSLSSD